MLYPVKILSPQGRVKKVISSVALSDMFWNSFNEKESNFSMVQSNDFRIPRWVKEKLDREFPEGPREGEDRPDRVSLKECA